MSSAPQIVLVSQEAPMSAADSAGVSYLTTLVQFLRDGGADVTVIVPDTPTNRKPDRMIRDIRLLLVKSEPGRVGITRRAIESIWRRLAPTRPPRGFISALRQDTEAMNALRAADVIDAQWPTMAATVQQLRRLAPGARLVTTLHDVASQGMSRQRRRARSASRWVRFTVATFHARGIEKRATAASDTVIVFSDKDRALLPNRRSVETVYPPLDTVPSSTPLPGNSNFEQVLLFVGPLYRGENREGLRWFVDEVWPQVLGQVPKARLQVAGKATDEQRTLVSEVPGIEFLGFVDDLEPHYAAASAVVAPLWVGAGVKFKVVDAMVRGVPTIGTSVAFEGIGESTLRPTASDSAEQFARRTVDALLDPSGARLAAEPFQTWAQERYSLRSFARRISGIYGLTAAQRTQPPPETLTASVVLPVLNGEHDIAKQLAALAGQDIAEQLDVVIADNGSTDGTRRVAQAYQQDFGQLRVIDAGDRKGANHARNIGLTAAACEKVLFCDHDDEVRPGWATQLRDALDHYDVVGGRITPIASGDEPPTQVYTTDGLGTVFGYLPYAVSSNMAVLRSAARKIQGFDESFAGGHEEVDFCWRLQQAGYSIGYEAAAEISYYQRASLRGRARQSYRAAQTAILLWVRHHERGALQPISLRGSVRGIITSPRYLPGLCSAQKRDDSARALGWVWGMFAGHMRYRIFRRTPFPRLMSS